MEKNPLQAKAESTARTLFSFSFSLLVTTTMLSTGVYGLIPNNPITENYRQVLAENVPPEFIAPVNGFLDSVGAPAIPEDEYLYANPAGENSLDPVGLLFEQLGMPIPPLGEPGQAVIALDPGGVVLSWLGVDVESLPTAVISTDPVGPLFVQIAPALATYPPAGSTPPDPLGPLFETIFPQLTGAPAQENTALDPFGYVLGVFFPQVSNALSTVGDDVTAPDPLGPLFEALFPGIPETPSASFVLSDPLSIIFNTTGLSSSDPPQFLQPVIAFLAPASIVPSEVPQQAPAPTATPTVGVAVGTGATAPAGTAVSSGVTFSAPTITGTPTLTGTAAYVVGGGVVYVAPTATQTPAPPISTPTATATPPIVNSLADPGNGVCDASECTLREAIVMVRPGETITFNSTLSGGTIWLGSTLTLSKNVVINGSALASQISISGNNAVRVFNVSSGVSATLQSLTIANGKCNGCDAGYANGGGIQNYGNLTISNSTVSNNAATCSSTGCSSYGGGIFNLGTLTISNSTVRNNSTSAFNPGATAGGGIGNNGGGTVTVIGSTISGNGSSNAGGIWNNSGSLVVTNSTFSQNGATYWAGGIMNSGSLTITNATFSGNYAGNSNGGGGIINYSTLNLTNTIIANSSGGDCVNNGTLVAKSNNLIEDSANACGLTHLANGNIVGFDPKLDTAGPVNNGGSTQTIALLAGSRALDTGNSTTCTAVPVSNLDQRGNARPVGSSCDIGAYEAPYLPPVVNSLADPGNGVCNGWECTLREAISAVGAGDTITFDSTLSGGIIRLGSALSISKNMSIDGSALASKVSISGDTNGDNVGDVNIFIIDANVTATLNSLNLTRGVAVNGPAAFNNGNLTLLNSNVTYNSVPAGSNGGALFSNPGTSLTITNSVFSNNSAGFSGGAMWVRGTTTISGSSFTSNSAANGGAISNDGTLSISDTSFTGNAASTKGGAIHNNINSSTTLTSVTLSSNNSQDGGAVANYGTLNATNSNFTNNTNTNLGAAILNYQGSLTLTSGTVNNNNGAWGGGIYDLQGTVNVNGTTFNGNTAASGGGGAIASNGGTITLIGCTISDNTASGNGGGVDFQNSLTVSGCTFSGNTAGNVGGAIHQGGGVLNVAGSVFYANHAVFGGAISDDNGTLTVQTSTFVSNSAGSGGGAISGATAGSMMTVFTSYFSNNVAGWGGAINNYQGSLTAINSTFYANTANISDGGGILNDGGSLLIEHGTLYGNYASGLGGGVRSVNMPMYMNNTIVAFSSSGGDCSSPNGLGENNANLVQDGSCSPALTGDPMLSAPNANGGLTQTTALSLGSPAIDAGNLTHCASIDQRGIARPVGAGCDIGAYESPFTPTNSQIVLYNAGTGTGSISGRSGIDAVCNSSGNKPAGYAQYHGFIAISAADSISAMPGNYGIPTNLPIKSPSGILIANNWSDLVDGSISNSLLGSGAVSFDTYWWSGAETEAGDSIDNVTSNCLNWTDGTITYYGNLGLVSLTGTGWMKSINASCMNSFYYICIASP